MVGRIPPILTWVLICAESGLSCVIQVLLVIEISLRTPHCVPTDVTHQCNTPLSYMAKKFQGRPFLIIVPVCSEAPFRCGFIAQWNTNAKHLYFRSCILEFQLSKKFNAGSRDCMLYRIYGVAESCGLVWAWSTCSVHLNSKICLIISNWVL